MYKNLLPNFYIALDAVIANRVRSVLTALGIIFGVAAVIAMLAIGNGAQQEILEQMKLVGVNNIVITPIIEQVEKEVEDGPGNKDEKNFSSGLTLLDVESIQDVVPAISKISPEILLETYIIKNGIRKSAKLVGVDNSYFEISNFRLDDGNLFNEVQQSTGQSVCIIGQGIKSKFFSQEDPIGKMIKVGSHWLKVVGILEERYISKKSISSLGIRDYNMDVYTPLQTALIRYKNRSLITEALLERFNSESQNNEEKTTTVANYHQLDRLVIQVTETDKLSSVSEIISRLLKRRHYGTVDYEITIPELLLKQQQRTNDIFNYVLGAIAGISLLVGGIGIMNIMLASVLERIKEIGLRLSLGAKKSDIVNQFLFEAVMISITGGIIGIVLGVTLAYVVSEVAEIPTIVSFTSIVLSFGVAATVGLIFGIAPARKAAQQDPISSLRYE
ncbi:ABC transporter permease protein [Fulvivirga imtechensis AK7]|uniref:ABC transporter permease protein n=1 Tax=Fulvivirga imtechensis AK7 TaxID=1237149 RepID=L8JNG4_9BACT|nr:ABC transporter permease [Fulvivirga imtechensis]ELR68912.1 ABC transporter permease protein [Fulvivirga imtechensis AK7]